MIRNAVIAALAAASLAAFGEQVKVLGFAFGAFPADEPVATVGQYKRYVGSHEWCHLLEAVADADGVMVVRCDNSGHRMEVYDRTLRLFDMQFAMEERLQARYGWDVFAGKRVPGKFIVEISGGVAEWTRLDANRQKLNEMEDAFAAARWEQEKALLLEKYADDMDEDF